MKSSVSSTNEIASTVDTPIPFPNKAVQKTGARPGEVEVVGIPFPASQFELFDPSQVLPMAFKPRPVKHAVEDGQPNFIGACCAIYGQYNADVDLGSITGRTKIKSEPVNWEDYYGELPNGAGYC